MINIPDLLPYDDRKFLQLDSAGDIVANRVELQDISTVAVFGGATTSTSSNVIAYGIKTFTLDIDDGKIIPGVGLEMQADDHDAFMFGVVVSKSTSVSPASVDVFVNKISAVTGTYNNWDLQIVSDDQAQSSLIAYSATSFTMAAGSKAFTIQSSKFMPVGSSVFGTALADTTQHFNGLVSNYSGTTVTVLVLPGGLGTGTFTAWQILNTSGYMTPALVATSTTANVIPADPTQSGNVATVNNIDIQSGVAFPAGTILLAVPSAAPTKYMWLQVRTYIVGQLVTKVLATSETVASPSYSSWVLTSTSLGQGAPLYGNGLYGTHDELYLNDSTAPILNNYVTLHATGVGVVSFAGNATISGTNTGDAGPMTTRGDLLTMNSTPAAARLAKGTANQQLVMNSAATDVAWGNPWLDVASASFPAAATVDVTIPAGYSDIIVSWSGASSNTASREFQVRVSTDGGSTYDSTAANYKGVVFWTDTTAPAGPSASFAAKGRATVTETTTTQTAAGTNSGSLVIHGYASGSYKPFISHSRLTGVNTFDYSTMGTYIVTTAITNIRLLWNGSGNFDAGTYTVSVK